MPEGCTAGGEAQIEGPSADFLEWTVKREIHEEVGITVKDRLNYIVLLSLQIQVKTR